MRRRAFRARALALKFRANVFAELWEQIRLMRADRPLWLSVIGNTYFWFLGTLFLTTVLAYGDDVLKVNSSRIALRGFKRADVPSRALSARYRRRVR